MAGSSGPAIFLGRPTAESPPSVLPGRERQRRTPRKEMGLTSGEGGSKKETNRKQTKESESKGKTIKGEEIIGGVE